MKAETDPISDDEWLIRLVWKDRVTDSDPAIRPGAFDPRDGRRPETDGISLYRKACLSDPADALLPFAEDKRSMYAIVEVPVSLLRELGLSVRPAPIDAVPGHVVIPELNITDYKADKDKFTPIKLRLAAVASEHILRRPADPD